MIPEIGQFALVIALMLALTQATLPLIGASRGNRAWIALAKPAGQAQFLFVALAFSCLAYSFITNDFSVLNVATNSNSQLPLHYRLAATWGSHEGSLLLWTLMLALWTVAVSLFSRHLPDEMVARVLSVMGIVSVGFLLFMLLTSNPFARIFPVPPDGRDLNPLLQDPAMVAHPPMLYMGYVGFSDRKSTRLNSSHPSISYAVFCLKKKKEYKPVRGYQPAQPTDWKVTPEKTVWYWAGKQRSRQQADQSRHKSLQSRSA